MDQKNEPIETEIDDSNPNAAGPQGLRGDMGVSSERTGPHDGADDDVVGTADGDDVQGTGSRGTSTTSTEGTVRTSGEDETYPQQEPAHGPEMDDTQQEATQGWRDEQEEANTAEVPSHEHDPSRNPGHSHG